MIEDDTKIDESVWLPDDEPVTCRTDVVMLRTERTDGRSGGVEYRVIGCPTLLDSFYAADEITADDYKNARDYHAWRDRYRAHWSMQPIPLPLDDIGLVATDLTLRRFMTILQKLSRLDQRHIDDLLDTHAIPQTMANAMRLVKSYRRMFYNLAQVMKELP